MTQRRYIRLPNQYNSERNFLMLLAAIFDNYNIFLKWLVGPTELYKKYAVKNTEDKDDKT